MKIKENNLNQILGFFVIFYLQILLLISNLGLPSQMQLVITHQAKPSAAPQILESKMVNITSVFISWSEIEDKHHNGPLTGYQVRRFISFCQINKINYNFIMPKYISHI